MAENNRLFCFTLIVLLAVTGCGPGGRLKTAPVTGKVTLDGKPLTFGLLIFSPANGRAAKGQIQSDGSFVLGTYEETDGAILDRHQVAVMVREKLEEESPSAPGVPRYGPSLVPEFYGDLSTSGLVYEVTDEKNEFHIKLSSKARPVQAQ